MGRFHTIVTLDGEQHPQQFQFTLAASAEAHHCQVPREVVLEFAQHSAESLRRRIEFISIAYIGTREHRPRWHLQHATKRVAHAGERASATELRRASIAAAAMTNRGAAAAPKQQ